MLWVLGKLSGIEAGHDVVQMYLSSGGREAPSWPCSQNVIFFPIQRPETAGDQLQQSGFLMGWVDVGEGSHTSVSAHQLLLQVAKELFITWGPES